MTNAEQTIRVYLCSKDEAIGLIGDEGEVRIQAVKAPIRDDKFFAPERLCG
jgi:hypothetical protein